MVGAGGAGLRAAVGLAESGLETACISKLVWTDSFLLREAEFKAKTWYLRISIQTVADWNLRSSPIRRV